MNFIFKITLSAHCCFSVLAVLTTFPVYAQSPRMPEGYDGFEDYFPVAVKCPSQSQTMFELITKKGKVGAIRLRAIYDGMRISWLDYGATNNQSKFVEMFVEDLRSDPKPKREKQYAKLVAFANSVKIPVCDGSPEQRQRVLSVIDQNAKLLGR